MMKKVLVDAKRLGYPGVRESLEELKGKKLTVLTNKPVQLSRDILAGLGMAACFPTIYGGDSFAQKKPDPVGVVKLMNDTGFPKMQTMMIGDSDTDVLTARNSGVLACGVTYGLGSRTFETTPPDFSIGDLRDLVPLLTHISILNSISESSDRRSHQYSSGRSPSISNDE
jgi:phosphoglycolate phosphatase